MIVTIDHRRPSVADLKSAGSVMLTTRPPAGPLEYADIKRADFVVLVENGVGTLVKSRYGWPLNTKVSL